MKVVIFNSIKGGVGKSTLAAQTISYLSHIGKSVGIFDADPQQTLTKWVERRNEAGEEYMNNIQLLPLDFDFSTSKVLDYVVIDSTGIDSEIGRRMLLEADIVISPLRPSQADIDTTLTHNNLIQGAKQHNDKLKLFYLLNACSTNWRDKERCDALSILNYLLDEKMIDAQVLNQAIFDRAILRSTFSEGLSCFDGKMNKSRKEIKEIIELIIGD